MLKKLLCMANILNLLIHGHYCNIGLFIPFLPEFNRIRYTYNSLQMAHATTEHKHPVLIALNENISKSLGLGVGYPELHNRVNTMHKVYEANEDTVLQDTANNLLS